MSGEAAFAVVVEAINSGVLEETYEGGAFLTVRLTPNSGDESAEGEDA